MPIKPTYLVLYSAKYYATHHAGIHYAVAHDTTRTISRATTYPTYGATFSLHEG
jgi:hypothetical protein